MDEQLIEEAKSLGINASLYYLLPPNIRENALKKDVARARKQSATDAE